ncbi:serine hydrolase domain-containing protein [Solimonas terrae]|uniref:Beta-lactamase family protein n=1 Tax=Solimonas terrae TaxID=1396819 RepID=A0A6M2BUV2_9GAMM|nr:serine hydrolase domain-containing protein [Solimonas terrae]NGY05717.1 beta-lactamase family protein [Solimonas terrae]
MRPRLLLSASIALAVSVLSACSGNQDGEPQPVYDWSALATTLDSFIGNRNDEVSGYSFALRVGGQTVFTDAGGDLTSDSVVAIASASKAPSAAVILSLVRDGKIDLDVPVGNYIGNAISWPADKAAITMRMLLNHTSGIPFNSPCMDDDSTTLSACAQEIADTDLNFTPGTKFGYSGAAYQIAGLVAEQVSGQSWATLVQQRLTTPLDMPSFTYGDTGNPRLAGGALCNAADYLKFTQMILDGGKVGKTRILDSSQIAAMQVNQVQNLPVFYSPVPSDSGLNGYSFGWWISDDANHPGSAGPELSDPGMFGSTPWLDFDQRYTAIILITSSTDTGIAMWNAVRPDILDQLNGTGSSGG